MPVKDKSVYHTNPEEALQVARDLKSKSGMHWGTVSTFTRAYYGAAKKI